MTESVPVTAVIPAFNRELTIARAVRSAVEQIPAPQEVIVVDDGSIDRTAEVAAEAGARVVKQSNQGEGGARNAGLQAATSPYVAFLDSDDEWLPGHLAALFGAVSEDAVVVGTAARGMPSGIFYGYAGSHEKRLGPNDVIWPDNVLVPSASLVKRSSAIAIGGFGKDPLCADLDFWIRLLETGPGLAVPKVTCHYHEHGEQVSNDAQGMASARREVVGRYADRTWYVSSTLRKLDISSAWDELCRERRAVNRSAAMTAAAFIVRKRGLVALAELLRYRRRRRSM